MFKNESDVVVMKAQKRYELLSQKSQASIVTRQINKWESVSESDSDSSGSSTDSKGTRTPPWNASPSGSITLPLTPPIEDQALGFFFANYKMKPSTVLRGKFEFVEEMLNRNDTEPFLQRSVYAASLATLANSTKSPFVMKRARQEYGAALAMTNKALSSRESAFKDSTLVCVMMLGLFEDTMYEGQEKIPLFMNHVAGACTLLSLRGSDIFKTDIGRRVFTQLHRTMLLSSFHVKYPMSTAMLKMREVAISSGVYKFVAPEWATKMHRWLNETIRLRHDELSSPAKMAACALRLIHEFREVRALMPEIFRYEIVYLEPPTEYVFGNSYHIYLDPYILQFWNIFRSLQLGLHQVLRDQLQKGLAQSCPIFPMEETRRQLEISENVTQEISADICASTPQITGQIVFPSSPLWQSVDIQQSQYKLHPLGTFLGAAGPTGMYYLIYPLWASGQNDTVSPGLTQFAVDRLYFIAHTIGSRQAFVFAEDLRQKLRNSSDPGLRPVVDKRIPRNEANVTIAP
jgi:hypothetical protein